MHGDAFQTRPGSRWVPAVSLLFLLLTCAAALPVQVTSVPGEMAQDMSSPAALSVVSNGEQLHLPALLSDYYAARGETPGWVSETGLQPAVGALLDALRSSGDEGLRPEDYHLQALQNLTNALRFSYIPSDWRTRRLAATELLLSDALLLLGEHELDGRVNPAGLEPQAAALQHRHELYQLLDSVMLGMPPDEALAALAPRDAGYTGLRAALARYRVLDETLGAPPVVPAGPALGIGDTGPRVATLVERLKFEGDLPPDASPGMAFDDTVRSAVRRFQARHGLAANGNADAVTLAALNEPVQTWMHKIDINLERMRWLPKSRPGTRLVANIADFHATLYLDGKPLLSEPVVVGQPYRQTPEFTDRIRYLVVNPGWEVPPVIAGEDLLPKIQADPRYLAQHHYQVLQGWNAAERPVEPADVDWSEWSADDLPYHFRQQPGPDNPLGRVKFMFPNRFGVYLHDTPAQELFSAEQRTFSSGCIRVAHALDLAETLLRLDGHADPAGELREALAAGSTRQLDLARPVPIYVVYFTAWEDDAGILQFRPDVYGRDPDLLRALTAPLPSNPACCNGTSPH